MQRDVVQKIRGNRFQRVSALRVRGCRYLLLPVHPDPLYLSVDPSLVVLLSYVEWSMFADRVMQDILDVNARQSEKMSCRM